MNDITPETFPKKPRNVLDGLPEYLKDPANYQKIRKALFEVLASRCGHSDPHAWTKCKKCLRRIHDHAEMVRKLGFQSPAQYYAWRKVHEHIETRVKLPKYNAS